MYATGDLWPFCSAAVFTLKQTMSFDRGFVFGMDMFLIAQDGMCVCVCAHLHAYMCACVCRQMKAYVCTCARVCDPSHCMPGSTSSCLRKWWLKGFTLSVERWAGEVYNMCYVLKFCCVCVWMCACVHVCVCVWMCVLHNCQFTRVLSLAGHEDWVRDVQFCQESKEHSFNSSFVFFCTICILYVWCVHV